MEKRKLTEEQTKKLYNNLAICFAVMGVILEILILIVPWGLYAITKNWAFIVFFLIAQLGIMPVIFLICGLGGIVCSILAIRKNKFKARYIFIVLLSVVMIFLGIANVLLSLKSADYRWEKGETSGYQDEWLMNRIENDYASAQFEKHRFNPLFQGPWWVEYCYGVYGDCVPVMMEGWITTHAERDDEIGNVVIHYRDGSSIDVWNNGEFYSLREAYEQGFLTEDDLKKIADIHNNRY